MSEELEKKWSEEYEKLAIEKKISVGNKIYIDLYLSACKKRQEEIDGLILERDFFERENVDYRNEIVTIKPKLKSRDAEIEKLKRAVEFENKIFRQTHSTMTEIAGYEKEYLEKIEKRDKLLELAYGNISENNRMGYEQEVQWLKDFEELKK